MAPEADPSNKMFFEIVNSPTTAIDPEVEQRSNAMYHFLVGRLQLTAEHFPEALEHLTKASELYPDYAPSLHAKLAELKVRAGDLEGALASVQRALEQDPDNMQSRFLYAGVLETMGRDGEASAIYQDLIKTNPDNFDAYVLLSALYIKNKEFDKSIQTLEALKQRSSQPALAHYYLGHAYELKQDLKTAETHYRKAFELEPRAKSAVGDLLRVQLLQGDVKRARAFAKEVISADPGNLIARRVLSQLLMGENQFDEALEHLNVLKTVEQDATETRFKIALIQLERQNYEEALRELLLVLAANPEHTEARFYLGSLYAAAGKNEEAIEELFKITPGDKMFVKSRTFAAFILRQERDLERAEKAVREALAESPDNQRILSYLILILRDAEKFESARELLEKAVETHADDPGLWFHYGVVLSDLGEEDEALEKMERVLILKPDHGDAMNFIAYSLAESQSDLPRAYELIQRALRTRPNDGYYIDTLGWVYYQMGKYQDAVTALEQAVKLAGNDMVILEHFGDALVKTNERERAIGVYKTSLEVGELSGKKSQDDVIKRVRSKLEMLQVEQQQAESHSRTQ